MFTEIFKQSPNVSKSPIVPKGIIFHHSAGSYSGSVSWCLNPTSKVSYHCMVDLNGNRTVLAKSTQRAWHAGKSRFKGLNDCNSFMLGISVSGNTNERDLTQAEIDSVAEWCVKEMRKYKIGLDWLTTHAIVSPGRKFDVSPEALDQIIERIKEIL